VGWVDVWYGQIVGLDTAPLIYYLEEHPTYLPLVDPFFDALARGDLHAVTSTVTLIEVLTQPLRHGDAALAAQYRSLLLNNRSIGMRAVSVAIAEQAARLRATYTLRTPDAVQLATALDAGASTFLTNDARLAAIPDLRVLVLDQLATPAAPPDTSEPNASA
jgi:predicted nucleic acid-binding protein